MTVFAAELELLVAIDDAGAEELAGAAELGATEDSATEDGATEDGATELGATDEAGVEDAGWLEVTAVLELLAGLLPPPPPPPQAVRPRVTTNSGIKRWIYCMGYFRSYGVIVLVN
ncbi:hypothetical protein [Cellvibrio sp.]|uniref:hypothetical protein n=1 Tax=Cellvibrio sp. TaxID=1965322 RepID=UPI003751A829